MFASTFVVIISFQEYVKHLFLHPESVRAPLVKNLSSVACSNIYRDLNPINTQFAVDKSDLVIVHEVVAAKQKLQLSCAIKHRALNIWLSTACSNLIHLWLARGELRLLILREWLFVILTLYGTEWHRSHSEFISHRIQNYWQFQAEIFPRWLTTYNFIVL